MFRFNLSEIYIDNIYLFFIKIFEVVLLFFLIIFVVVGNGFVIYVIYLNYNFYSLCNVFVVSLVVVDLMLVCIDIVY